MLPDARLGVGREGTFRCPRPYLLFSVTPPGLEVEKNGNVCVGEIDGDPFLEIIAMTPTGTNLIAFEHDGTHKWTSQPIEPYPWGGAPALADLDADGSVEVVAGNSAYSANGTSVLPST